MLMFGAGGTAVEVIADTAHALPPLDFKLARRLMRETRIYRLLEGYRDRPRADLDAIALTLVRLSSLVAAHPEIRELDINPLLADEQGCVALDARVRIADAVASPRQPMAIRPYPVAWETNAELDGIGRITMRPIRPEDEDTLRSLLCDAPPDDLRMRFFTAAPDLSHKRLAADADRLRARDGVRRGRRDKSGELLGVARLVADPDYWRAEYAVLVRSDLKGHGLGWQLMQHLIAYARHEKLGELFG